MPATATPPSGGTTSLAPAVIGTALKINQARGLPSGEASGHAQAKAIGGAVGGLAATVLATTAVTTAVTAATTTALGAGAAALAGAAAGSVVPIIGTIIGAAIGVAIATLGGGKITQHEGPNSVSGHKIIMAGLVKAQRWDDCDAFTAAWFKAGFGTDAEKALFKPKSPAKLKNGKANHSMVARFGHQDKTEYAAIQATLKNGQTIVIPGKGGYGTISIGARGDVLVITNLTGKAAYLPSSKPDGSPESIKIIAKAKAVLAQVEATKDDFSLPDALSNPVVVIGGGLALVTLVVLIARG